jgi:hypothetical protein
MIKATGTSLRTILINILKSSLAIVSARNVTKNIIQSISVKKATSSERILGTRRNGELEQYLI